MAEGRFEERLRQLEQERGPASPRRAPEAAPAPVEAARSSLGQAGPVLRFGLGALWLFATMQLAASMQAIQDSVTSAPSLRPHEDAIMLTLVILIGVSMVGFAWRIKRTAFRVHRRDAGWALTLGAVAGFVLGVGPQEVYAIAMARAGL